MRRTSFWIDSSTLWSWTGLGWATILIIELLHPLTFARRHSILKLRRSCVQKTAVRTWSWKLQKLELLFRIRVNLGSWLLRSQSFTNKSWQQWQAVRTKWATSPSQRRHCKKDAVVGNLCPSSDWCYVCPCQPGSECQVMTKIQYERDHFEAEEVRIWSLVLFEYCFTTLKIRGCEKSLVDIS